MMTSMAVPADTNYFMKLGFSTYFFKPAITRYLLKILSLPLSDNDFLLQELPLITDHYLTEVKPEDMDISNKNFNECRLLLVEDNRINQKVARHILAEFDITPDIAVNGLEVLALLKSKNRQTSTGKASYDMILMDCQMPEMDGYQATQAIRNGEAGEDNKAITIIAMTANTMKGDKEKCLASGMTDYLSKPIDPTSIKEKLFQYFAQSSVNELGINQATPILETKTIIKVPQEVTAAVAAIVNIHIDDTKPEQLVIWQRYEFSKRLNNNEIIQQKLIELFLEETPKKLNELAKSIEQGNNILQHEISHKIQGMSANLSAHVLLQYAKDFNHYVKQPDPAQDIVEALFQAMQLSYQLLEQELKKH
ncbi:MAG TPA: hypothetical protein DIS98_15110 [Colwellia sp.]|nr:hypothetical protein [Colwellia sp.]